MVTVAMVELLADAMRLLTRLSPLTVVWSYWCNSPGDFALVPTASCGPFKARPDYRIKSREFAPVTGSLQVLTGVYGHPQGSI